MGSSSSSEERRLELSMFARQPDLLILPRHRHRTRDVEFMRELRQLNYNAYYYYADPTVRSILDGGSGEDSVSEYLESEPSTPFQIVTADKPSTGCAKADSVCSLCLDLVESDCVGCSVCTATFHYDCVVVLRDFYTKWVCPNCRGNTLPIMTNSAQRFGLAETPRSSRRAAGFSLSPRHSG